MVEKRGNDAIVWLLANTELFKDLEAKDLAACADAFRELRFKKGPPWPPGAAGAWLHAVRAAMLLSASRRKINAALGEMENAGAIGRA